MRTASLVFNIAHDAKAKEPSLGAAEACAMDFRFPHRLKDLQEALGEPNVFTYGSIDGPTQSVGEGYRFPCGCEATPVQGEGSYVVTFVCVDHMPSEPDTVRVSDRRRPNVFGLRFSYQTTGLLTELVAAQQGAERTGGCADVAHPAAEFVGQEESVRELVDARILGKTDDGGYRLLVFNCWDETTREWF
jgi:hypothetical protein